MLKTNNLAKSFQNVKILKNISLVFPQKGLIFIIGKSGSGKSTLLNLLGGLDYPTVGDIEIYDRQFKNFTLEDFDAYRNYIVGFVFQEFNLFEELDVLNNLQIKSQLQAKNINHHKIKEMLTQLDLTDVGGKTPNQLSGGQKQRVAIARALITDPKIILADEPTGNLDKITGEKIFKILKKISQERLVIVVSHDEDNALTYGEQIIKMQDGEIIKDTDPQIKITKPDILPIDKNQNDNAQEVMHLLNQPKNQKNNHLYPTTKNLTTEKKISYPILPSKPMLSWQTTNIINKNNFKNNKKIYLQTIITTSFGSFFGIILILLLIYNIWDVLQNGANLNKMLIFGNLYFSILNFFNINQFITKIIEFKTKEIGILKALGAFKKDIKKIFHIINFKLSIYQTLGIQINLVILSISTYFVLLYIDPTMTESLETLWSQTKGNISKDIGIFFLNLYLLLSLIYPLIINTLTLNWKINKLLKKYPLGIIKTENFKN